MPATRLLVVADAKLIAALAGGLREGARFEVTAAPLSDLLGAVAAAEKAEAAAVFYGAPGSPLAPALQALSSKLRERGGRLIAVLQREQAAQRDECFRAGAGDVLFMPMPKEQFVARILGAVGLSFDAEGGASSAVSVATRTSSSKLEQASVSAAGVQAPSQLPFKAGETVRLSWATFQSWGLVVQGGPTAQIRFAGLSSEEEAPIREWVKTSARPAALSQAPAAPPATAAPAPGIPNPTDPRAAPASGPPPGFAERKGARAQPQGSRPAPRVSPPVMASPGAPAAAAAVKPAPRVPPPVMAPPGAPAAAAAPPAPTVPPPARSPAKNAAAAVSAAPAASGLSASIFEDGAGAPAAPGEAAAPSAPAGPVWPAPPDLAAARDAALQIVKDKSLAKGLPPALAASARKITNILGSGARDILESGADSPLSQALALRIALDAATSEGAKLYSKNPPAEVDQAAVAAMVKLADEAAAGLQKEANEAIGKGELERLQMITAASAALGRDLLNFRATADRLRGQAAAPRLGAGALDPDMVLPGQASRPAGPKPIAVAAPVRAELRDFQNLDRASGHGKKVALVLGLLLFIAALVNALYFVLPRREQLPPGAAGPGVVRIDVAGEAALVIVTQEWVDSYPQQLPRLVDVLRTREVAKAILRLPTGVPAGILDVKSGKAGGVPKMPATEPPPK